MIKVSLSIDARLLLVKLHQNHIHHVIRQRAHVLLLRSENSSNDKISSMTGLSEPTIIDDVHQYLEKGEPWVTTLNFRKPTSQLQAFDEVIKAHFDKNPVSTISQACKEVLDLTGIAIKNTQMRSCLKTLDIKWRKVGSVPAKVDIGAQQKFHDEQLQPRLEEAKAGKRNEAFILSMQRILLWVLFWVFSGALLVSLSGHLPDANVLMSWVR